MVRGRNNELNQLLLEEAIAVQSRPKEAPVIRNPSSKRTTPDFEEIIRDIDESINTFTGISNSNLDLDKILQDNEERMLLDVPVFVADPTQLGGDLSKDMKGSGIQCEVVLGCEFQAGWTSSVGIRPAVELIYGGGEFTRAGSKDGDVCLDVMGKSNEIRKGGK
nr:hypothetical protein CFP56_02393 [Quercus suber]